MSVKIYSAKLLPPRPRGSFRERYKFDDLEPGQCMELTQSALDDDVDRIVAAYGSYAQYRGIKYSRERTETGYIIWRFE